MIPATIYTRRSSQSGDQQNLTTQEIACREYCAANGLSVERVVPHNFTGTVPIKDRGDIGAALWSDIVSGQVRALVVHHITRLSRSEVLDCLSLVREINSHGCAVYSTEIGLVDTRDIVTIVRAWASSEERKQIVEKLQTNRKSKAARAYVGTGNAPYGYIKVGQGRDARLEIDKDKSEIVKWIYNEYAFAAVSMRSLMSVLNARGVPSPAGKLWRVGRISSILSHRVYIGVVSFGEVEHVDEKLRIIPQSVFDLAQQRLKENAANSKRNARGEYIMRGRVLCYCKRKMVISTKTGPRGRPNYKCGTASYPRELVCNGAVRIHIIDALAAEYIKWAISDDVLALGVWRSEQRQTIGGTQSIDGVEAEIAEAERARDRLYDAFGKSGDESDRKAIENAKQKVFELCVKRDAILNAAETERIRSEARMSLVEHVQMLRYGLEHPSFELLSDLVRIVDVHACLIRDDDGRAVVFTCGSEIAPEKVYRLG